MKTPVKSIRPTCKLKKEPSQKTEFELTSNVYLYPIQVGIKDSYYVIVI